MSDYMPSVEDMREWVREHAYTDGDIVSAIGMLEIVLANERAKALEEFRRDFGREFAFQDPYGHFDPATMSACHRQMEGFLDARAARIRDEVGK